MDHENRRLLPAGTNTYIVKFQRRVINGRMLFVFGEAHPEDEHNVKDRAFVAGILKKEKLTPRNTVILSEPHLYHSYRFREMHSGMFSFRVIPLEKDGTVEHQKWMTIRNENLLQQLLLHSNLERASEIRRMRPAELAKLIPSIKKAHTFALFRDFLHATTIRWALTQESLPKNIIVLQGATHTDRTLRFVTDEKYYERYRTHLLQLAPRLGKDYQRVRKTNKRREIRDKLVRKVSSFLKRRKSA